MELHASLPLNDAQNPLNTTSMTTETMTFGADVARLLEIVTHALYSNRDVFLRELISNSADACDRLRYESIQNPALSKSHSGYFIRVVPDTKTRRLSVIDTGIGMSRDELIEHLGTIAKSGTRALMEQIKQNGDSKGGPSLIGQFGVGFYASFMSAHKVRVISRKAGSSETWAWESDDQNGFSIEEATQEDCAALIGPCGTAVFLSLKDDSSDFLLEEKVRQVITTYANHISLPVYIGKDSTEPANTASALWMRPKSEITPDQYDEFFNAVSGSMGMDSPLVTSHWRAEGKIEYTALLFLPNLRPFDLYDPTRRHAVRLYVRRVFITDDCEGLIFPWLRFLRGVIDSEDLPLNVSREMLQHNQIIHKIRSGVAKHILADLDKLSKDDPVAFTSFWHQFGAVIKEGLYDATEHREDIFKIARFFTSANPEVTSLSDYLSRMKPQQDQIFYISGENVETLRNSPQLEGFKKRGLEVLLLKDTIDDFWLPVVSDFEGKKFVSITKGAVDLSKFPIEGEDELAKPAREEARKESESLLSFLKTHLEDKVSDVRLSDRLTDSPVCLIASDKDIDLHMGRVLKIHQQYETKVKPVLEINATHPLIVRLSEMAKSSALSQSVADAADLLMDQALIMQGEPISDPAGFARRMADFMRRGLAA